MDCQCALAALSLRQRVRMRRDSFRQRNSMWGVIFGKIKHNGPQLVFGDSKTNLLGVAKNSAATACRMFPFHMLGGSLCPPSF